MSDSFVTIATFSSPFEAHLVHGILDGECLRVILSGENATSVFAGMGSAFAEITLQVHPDDLARANDILNEYEMGFDERDDQEDEDEDEAGWVCSQCGEEVDELETVCPSCETARGPSREEAIAKAPRLPRKSTMVRTTPRLDNSLPHFDQFSKTPQSLSFPPVTEDDQPEIIPPGDELAHRAFLTAVFSFLFFPLVFYAAWLLFKVMTYSGELSPASQRKVYATMACIVIVGLFTLSILGFFLR